MGDALEFRQSAVVLTAVQLDFFNRLLGGASRSDFETFEEDTDGLTRLARALVAMDLLENNGDVFMCSPQARNCLTDDGDHDLRPILRHFHEVYRMWGELDEAIRTGQHYTHRTDETFTAEFTEAMEARAHFNKQEVAENLSGVLGNGRLLDLAGGSGVYARALLYENPGATAVLADSKPVLSAAEDFIEADGMTERISLSELDIVEDDEYGSGFDVVLLSAVIHIFAPDTVAVILERTLEALRPGGTVAIRDYVLSNEKTDPLDGVLFNLMMYLATDEGQTYSEKEYETLLSTSGFDEIQRIKLADSSDDLILARRPG